MTEIPFVTLNEQHKPRILIVGEHPAIRSGNSMMLEGIMKQIDREKYNITLFLVDDGCAMDSLHNYIFDEDSPIGTYIPAGEKNNIWGPKKLAALFRSVNFHMIFFVGIDIWRYSLIENELYEESKNGMRWCHLFPYDLQYPSKIWPSVIEKVQFPFVYSKWGLDMVINDVPKVKYFRPPNGNEFLYEKEMIPWRDKLSLKSHFYPDLNPETLFVFGSIAPPQRRKNLIRQIKAFSLLLHNQKQIDAINEVHGKKLEFVLYLHTEENQELLNLEYLMTEWDIPEDKIRTKPPNSTVTKEMVPILMQTFDCLLNCSFQEGLSWTVLEAMILGIPIIASDSTAHKELLEEIGILVVPHETDFIIHNTPFGISQVEAKVCSSQSIAKAMEILLMNPNDIEDVKTKLMERAQEWISGIDDVNLLIEDVLNSQPDKNIEGELL